MDLRKLIPVLKTKHSLWQLQSNNMLPNLLLANKLLFSLLIFNGFYALINDPFVPFVSILDKFNSYPNLFKYLLRASFIFFGFMLLFNFKTRLSSIALGLVVFLTLLSSKVVFRNHIFIVGCIFFLSGLSNNKGLPWLIILQMSILYAGTSLNKIFELDWWTGIFMDNWLGTAIKNPIYIHASNIFPELVLAKVLSWSVIIVELIIGALFLSNKRRSLGIWLIIIFHISMFTMIHAKFGHFLQDLLIVLLVFLKWPEEKISVQYGVSTRKLKFVKLLDWSNNCKWEKVSSNKEFWLEVKYKDQIKENKLGIKSILTYSSGFYVVLLAIDQFESYLLTIVDVSAFRILIHLVYISFIWYLIYIFLPIKVANRRIIYQKNLVN